jgi:RNA polymerase sigma factor (sigma-70 family)
MSQVMPSASGPAEALVADDASVLAGLLANHQRFLQFLERRLGRRDLAEEMLQEAYLRASAARSLPGEESAVAWFYRVLRNALVDHHRRADSEQRALAALRAESDDAPAEAEPDQALMRAVCHCIDGLLDTLKPEYAQAVRRVDMEDASLPDLAAEAGITPGNASVRLHRARQAMRKRIEQCCGACARHGCLHGDCTCPSVRPEESAR